jgi:hypothetical protein
MFADSENVGTISIDVSKLQGGGFNDFTYNMGTTLFDDDIHEYLTIADKP